MNKDPYDDWFATERGSSEDYEIESDVDEVDFDVMSDEPEDM